MIIHDYFLSEVNIEEALKYQNIKEFLKDQQKKIGEKKKEIINKIMKSSKSYNGFTPTKEDINQLPKNSFLFQISFTLKKPYTSKGEGEFFVTNGKTLGNPIIRDKFLCLPIVRATTLKGNLRFTAIKAVQEKKTKNYLINRLFGSKPEDEEVFKGRLYFFPIIFREDAERDIITPIERTTRIPVPAKAPISLEIMEANSKGDFYLLYIHPSKKDSVKEEVYEDLKFVTKLLKEMFYYYGFSAKKSSGFGIIKEELRYGRLWIKISEEIKEVSFSTLIELSEQISILGEKING